MNADIPLPRSHGPSMAKMLVIFIVSSIGLLVVNDLVFYNLFKGSIVKDHSQFAKKSEMDQFRSTLNLTIDQRAEIAVSHAMSGIHNTIYEEVGKLRNIIYEEKDVLSKQIEDKATEVRNEFKEENSKLKDKMNSEHSNFKTQLKNIKEELGQEITTLKQDLEAIKKASDSMKGSIKELRNKLSGIDVNKEQAFFEFKINDYKKFISDFSEDENASNLRVSEFFQVRGISWYLEVESKKSQKGLFIRLFPHNRNDNHDWRIRADFVIGLISSHGLPSPTPVSDHTFRKETQQDGYEQFISYEEIDEGEYVKNDSIEAYVHLKADKLIRSSVL